VGAERDRRDGWLVTYSVEVLFDTDNARCRYDHVGTLARCTCCGESFDLHRSTGDLIRHARRHEGQLSVDDERAGHTVAVSDTITRKEVGPRP
jgi:hypothetical protein